MVVTEISVSLWLIFFGFSVVFGILTIRKAFTKEFERPQREYYLGIAIFILIHILARVFYFIFDFVNNQEIFWELGALVGIGSVIFMLYAIERNVYTRTKFLITIITIINLVLLLIFALLITTPLAKTIIQTINTALVGLFIPLIYIYVAYKSSGVYRRNSLLIAIGIIIFLAGQTAHSRGFYIPENPIYYIISPTLMLIGGIIFLYGLLRTK